MTPRPGPSPSAVFKVFNVAAGGEKSGKIVKGKKIRGSGGDSGSLKQLTLEEAVTPKKTKTEIQVSNENDQGMGGNTSKVGGDKRSSNHSADSPPKKRRSSGHHKNDSKPDKHKQLDIRVMVNKSAQSGKAPEAQDKLATTESQNATNSPGTSVANKAPIPMQDHYPASVKESRGAGQSAGKKSGERVKSIEVLELESSSDSDTDRESSCGSDSDTGSDSDVPEDEYEVESIVDFWNRDGVEEYLVKWKGYAASLNTWEPKCNLHCEEKLNLFFLRRLEEIRRVKEQYKDNEEELKSVMKNLPLPNDPRALHDQVKYFLRKISYPLTEGEIKDNYKAYRLGRIKKSTTEKLQLNLRNAILGKSDLNFLRGQLAILEGENRYIIVEKSLMVWEQRLNKITNGKPKITVENLVDLEGPPRDFTYRNTSVAGNGVVIPNDPLTGCECDKTCGKGTESCAEAHFDFKLSYTVDKRVKVANGVPIYECNQHCQCGPDCTNRVVQDGTISLVGAEYCIFRTKNDCGWGVRTLKPIKKGTFVALYAGEVIKSSEAERRGPTYDREGLTYLFDLDFNRVKNPYTIDAKHIGNISHFINHSCEPNLHVYNVFVECVDPDMPKLALFAARDIKQNEELSFDYMSNGLTNKKHKRNPLQLMTCHCGKNSCKVKVF